MATQWQASARIVQRMGEWRQILAFLFALWGIGGFIWIGVEALSAVQLRATIGVHAAAGIFIAMLALWWIGGMVLLGIAALLAAPRTAIERPIEV